MNNKIITYLENEGFHASRESCRYFRSGEEFFARLMYELNRAKSYIFIEFFNIEEGRLFQDVVNLLRYKVEQGVDVRLSYDRIGSLSTLPRSSVREMTNAGIKVFPFIRARRFSRFGETNHRKMVVIDGEVAFCGGLNLADRYANVREFFGHWKDTGVMTTLGDDSPLSTVIPMFDSPNERVWERTFINFVTSAQKYVYITTPYIICTSGVISVLATAAKSGIDVRIITPFIADKRVVKLATESYYEELLANKIRVFEYTPGFLHAKSIVSDDCRAFVGSANLDYRSLYRSYECGVCMFDSQAGGAVSAVKHDFVDILGLCREITSADLAQVSKFKRGVKRTARIFGRLF